MRDDVCVAVSHRMIEDRHRKPWVIAACGMPSWLLAGFATRVVDGAELHVGRGFWHRLHRLGSTQ